MAEGGIPVKSIGKYMKANSDFIAQAASLSAQMESGLSIGQEVSGDESFIIISENADGTFHEDDENKEMTEQESNTEGSFKQYPLPFTPLQQRFLKDKPSVRGRILRGLERKGHNVRLNFETSQLEIETQESQNDQEVINILRNSVVEMNIDLNEAEKGKMDIIPDQPFSPYPMSSSDNEILAVVDSSGTSVKIVGLSDDMKQCGKRFDEQRIEASPETMAGPAHPNPGTVPGQVGSTTSYPDSGSGHVDPLPEAISERITRRIDVKEAFMEYILQYKEDIIKKLEKDSPGVTIEIDDEGFNVMGPRPSANKAADELEKMARQIRCDKFTFATPVNMASFTEASQTVGLRKNVKIDYKQSNMMAGNRMSRIGTTQTRNSPLNPLPLPVNQVSEAKVFVVIGRLENQKADILVNSTNVKLDLADGNGVSNSILKAAGNSIQEELRTLKPKGIEHTDVAVSGTGNLDNCKNIYHVALPFHKGFSATKDLHKCYEYLASVVFRILILASRDGYKTIALPAFGAGALDYPLKNLVQLMFRAIQRYNEDQRAGGLKTIYIVISPESKKEAIQLLLAHQFTHHMKTRLMQSPTASEVSRDKTEVRAKVSSVLLQVIHGDVTKICDVMDNILVLWTETEITAPNNKPDLKSINSGKTNWRLDQVSGLPTSGCLVDRTSEAGKILIHTYCRTLSEKSAAEAIGKGLKEASKAGVRTIGILIPEKCVLVDNPRETALAITTAVKRQGSGIDVVTVVIDSAYTYIDFTAHLARKHSLEKPADISTITFVDTLWNVSFSQQAQRSLNRAAAFNTGIDATMVVIADSEQLIEQAAQDVGQELNVGLLRVPSNLGTTRSTR